ncbi:MAG: PAS domain-containing protein, partial [Chloroflexi bacterium]|nr:PAS domain-containing protein [Chloroflexota bacterium]
MSVVEANFLDEFSAIVDSYIKTESESALYQASELGRRLVAQRVGPEELVTMHFRIMQRIAATELPEESSRDLLKASHVLLEVVMAHGLAFREYLEAQETEFQRIQQFSTQIQQQKEGIATAHQQLQTIIDQMVDGLVEMDAIGRVLLANPAAERVLEVPSAQLVSRPIWDCLLPVRHDDFYKAMTDMQRDKVPIQLPGTKGERYYKLTLAPVLDEERHIYRTLLLIRDVTKEEEANRVRNELVSMVSHELRTPL